MPRAAGSSLPRSPSPRRLRISSARWFVSFARTTAFDSVRHSAGVGEAAELRLAQADVLRLGRARTRR